MNLISPIRRRSRPLGRLIISVFLVVWLNMALQPCLMAAAPLTGHADHDCPHCPEPASHCDEGSKARCTWVDGYDFDGRHSAADAFGADDRISIVPFVYPAPAVPHRRGHVQQVAHLALQRAVQRLYGPRLGVDRDDRDAAEPRACRPS